MRWIGAYPPYATERIDMTDFGLGDHICENLKPHEQDTCLLLRALMWHGLDERRREYELANELEDAKSANQSGSTRGRRQQYMKISKPRDPMESEATK